MPGYMSLCDRCDKLLDFAKIQPKCFFNGDKKINLQYRKTLFFLFNSGSVLDKLYTVILLVLKGDQIWSIDGFTKYISAHPLVVVCIYLLRYFLNTYINILSLRNYV